MIKKGILLFCMCIFIVGALYSNQTLATASVVFRALKKTQTPIPPPEASLTITPNVSTIDTSTYSGMTLWDIDNDVINFEHNTAQLFTWEFSANSFSPITLRFIMSPLRLKTNASRIINYTLSIAVDSSTFGPYFLYDHSSSTTDFVEHELSLSSLVTSADQVGFVGQITKQGKADSILIQKADGTDEVEKTPYIIDLMTNVVDQGGSAVATGSTTTEDPLEITFALRSSHWNDITREDAGHVFPLNINATRRGTGTITLDVADMVEYGEYLSQLYIELEVQ